MKAKKKPTCGLVMPISSMGNYSEKHWRDVYRIISKNIEESTNFFVKMVSDSDHSGVIQKAIVNNLYHNEIVIADVSGKNPNVMFELGMRLAFDKPTVVIKDELTDFSFDTSPIEHLIYDSSLNAIEIESFVAKLVKKVEGTFIESTRNKNYSTFLKHFGEFKLTEIESNNIPVHHYLELMQKQLAILTNHTIYNEAFSNEIVHENDPESMMNELRSKEDLIDMEILKLISNRQKLSQSIGRIKRDLKMTILQPTRWQKILDSNRANGQLMELSENLILKLTRLLHDETIEIQESIYLED